MCSLEPPEYEAYLHRHSLGHFALRNPERCVISAYDLALSAMGNLLQYVGFEDGIYMQLGRIAKMYDSDPFPFPNTCYIAIAAC